LASDTFVGEVIPKNVNTEAVSKEEWNSIFQPNGSVTPEKVSEIKSRIFYGVFFVFCFFVKYYFSNNISGS